MRWCPKRKNEVDEKLNCMKCTFWNPEKLFPCTFKQWNFEFKKVKDNPKKEIENA